MQQYQYLIKTKGNKMFFFFYFLNIDFMFIIICFDCFQVAEAKPNEFVSLTNPKLVHNGWMQNMLDVAK